MDLAIEAQVFEFSTGRAHKAGTEQKRHPRSWSPPFPAGHLWEGIRIAPGWIALCRCLLVDCFCSACRMTFLSLRPYVRCLPECTYLRVNVCKCASMYLGTYVGVLVSMRVHVCGNVLTYLCESVGCSAQQTLLAGGNWCTELGGASQLQRAFYTTSHATHPDKI